MALSGQTNEEKIWDYLLAKGLNSYGVAGLMGNLYAESGLLSNNLQNTSNKKLGMTDQEYTDAVDNGSYTNFVKDSAGYGLAQWTYWSRKQALLDFAKAAGVSIGDLEMQLDFLFYELSTGYTNSVLNVLKSATSVLQASNAVLLNFERPADQSTSVQTKRSEYGQVYFDKFAGQTTVEKGDGNLSAIERLIATAKAEEGYLEKASNSQLDSKTANAGSNNYTKYARDLDNIGNIYNGKKNGYAWCDVFVDWCFITTFGVELAMKLLCQSYGGAGAGCTYSAQYYKNKGQFYTKNPQAGDQIFFTSDGGKTSSHTGIVTDVSNGKVYTIEGNTSSAAGVVANGGCVRSKSYSLSYSCIYGYGRPDWTLVNETEVSDVTVNYQGKVVANGGLNCRTSPIDGTVLMTYPNGTIVTISKERNGWGYTGTGWVSLNYIQKIQTTTEQEDDDMDVTRFKELWHEMRKELQDNDAGTWSQEARDWCVTNGIVAGGSATEFNGMWEDVLTREQMAVMMYRFAKLIGQA